VLDSVTLVGTNLQSLHNGSIFSCISDILNNEASAEATFSNWLYLVLLIWLTFVNNFYMNMSSLTSPAFNSAIGGNHQ
jgi:hypothetical protein